MHARSARLGRPRRQRHGRHRIACCDVFGDPARDALPSRRLPDLERPTVPAETPAYREIDIARVVRDLREMHGAVVEGIAINGPQELRLADRRSRANARNAPRCLSSGGFPRRCRRPCPRTPDRCPTADRARECRGRFSGRRRARLLAERALLDQPVEPCRQRVVAMPGIVGKRLAHGVHDVRERIEPDDVGGAEGRAPRPSDQRAGERIDRVEADAEALRVMNRRKHREHADAIGDEVRRVLRAHHALAERRDQERFELVEQLRRRFGRRNQLDEMHVARRIEEMHAAKAMTELRRQRLREAVDRQPRGIAREDRMLAEVRRDLAVQIRLPVHALGDRLDHEIALAQERQMLVVVRRLDVRRARRGSQAGRLELAQVVDRLAHVAVGIALLRGSSKSSAGTAALTRCAAICAPMTPAPRTAALRMTSGDVDDMPPGLYARYAQLNRCSGPARSGC